MVMGEVTGFLPPHRRSVFPVPCFRSSGGHLGHLGSGLVDRNSVSAFCLPASQISKKVKKEKIGKLGHRHTGDGAV